MLTDYVLAALIVGGFALSDRFANRDQLTGRRFAQLSGDVVQSEIDLSRNKRWHTEGLIVRVIVAALIAGLIGWALRSWPAVLCGAGVLGFSVSLWFDVMYNLRNGKAWDYTGTTSATDRATNGRRQACIELAGIVASAVAWKLFV